MPFSGPDNSQILPLSVGNLDSHVICGCLAESNQTASRSVQPLLHSSPVCQTHRQADHATCDICSNWPHLCTACRRCGHSCERICTKFGMWNPYTLQMVMWVSERRWSPRPRAPRRPRAREFETNGRPRDTKTRPNINNPARPNLDIVP